MNDTEQAAAVDANYWGSFALLGRACGGEVLEDDGVLAITTGFPVAMLNIGFIQKPLADPEGALTEIVRFFDDRNIPFLVRIREGVDPKTEEAAEAMGMPYSNTVPGMAMFPIGDPPPPPDAVTIQQVTNEEMLGGYRSAMAEGFGMPLKMVERMIQPSFLELAGWHSFLASVDGQPVATSSLYAADGTAGIYNVATVASHRGRGIGEALTWRAVSRGREQGCAIATLQASLMGKPVYERMGFRTVAPYRTFERPEKAAS